MVSDIEVHNISKVFEYYKRETGMKNFIRNFWHREGLYKEAVHDLSFSVERGNMCHVGAEWRGEDHYGQAIVRHPVPCRRNSPCQGISTLGAEE